MNWWLNCDHNFKIFVKTNQTSGTFQKVLTQENITNKIFKLMEMHFKYLHYILQYNSYSSPEKFWASEMPQYTVKKCSVGASSKSYDKNTPWFYSYRIFVVFRN